jgi:hypothetical protein
MADPSSSFGSATNEFGAIAVVYPASIGVFLVVAVAHAFMTAAVARFVLTTSTW